MNFDHKKAQKFSAAILCFLCLFVAKSQTPNRGDFVLIQFGHNDAGKINDDTRARGARFPVREKRRRRSTTC